MYTTSEFGELKKVENLRIMRDFQRNNSFLVFGVDPDSGSLNTYRYYSNQNESNFKIVEKIFLENQKKIENYDVFQMPLIGYGAVISNDESEKTEIVLITEIKDSKGEKFSKKILMTIEEKTQNLNCRWPEIKTYYQFECIYTTETEDNIYHIFGNFDNKTKKIKDFQTDTYILPKKFEDGNCKLTSNLIVCTLLLPFNNQESDKRYYELVWPKKKGSFNGNGFTLKMREIGKKLCKGGNLITPLDYDDDTFYSVEEVELEKENDINLLSVNRTGCVFLNFSFDESKDRMGQLEGKKFKMYLSPLYPELTLELTQKNFKIFKIRAVKNWVSSAVFGVVGALVLMILSAVCYKICLKKNEERRKKRIMQMEERRRRAVERANREFEGNEMVRDFRAGDDDGEEEKVMEEDVGEDDEEENLVLNDD